MPAHTANVGTTTLADGPRRILPAVTGMTPQVVTETLYALMQQGPQALPHELHLLTTAVGAERARLALLSEQPGWFQHFLADYQLAPIRFDASRIHVLQDAAGQPMADIRSADDNALAADQVADLVRRFTARADVQLHVSLAGGRKTLGYFAGYALSLWGRDGDRLSHVLVSDPYESSWDFLYPAPYERIIKTAQNRLVDCAQAEVTLADIPFVRLRHGLPEALLDGRAGFAQAVAAAQAGLAPPRLVLDLAQQPDKNQSELAALMSALKKGQHGIDVRIAMARQVQAALRHAGKWREKTDKKNPLKDHDHQDTLLVIKWLAGS